MDVRIKLVIINASFQMEYYSRRWKLFAQQYKNCDVTLLMPIEHEWYADKTNTFGRSFTLRGKSVDEENFHMRTFNRVKRGVYGYISTDLKEILLKIKPDFIYEIGGSPLELRQILLMRKKFLPSTKVALFSMRGPALTLRIKKDSCNPLKWIARRVYYYTALYIQNFNYHHVDAIFCHYPDAVKCFKKEGFLGPIYMQTQVGVNSEWFHENLSWRKEIRQKYNISDNTFVFGSATRFTVDKGVDIILKSLPKEGDWKYLMMGSGTEADHKRLHKLIDELHLKDKVIQTGFVDWYDMGKYWNAVDCAIHVPLTTSLWEETFSLAAIQPQITKKPVIGDTSGSVPYQIGFEEMIVPENDVNALNKKIDWVLNHKDDAAIYGLKMFERTLNSFEVKKLNQQFYDTIFEDILLGKYDLNKYDMVNYTKRR